MKNLMSFLRITLFLVFSFILLEVIVESGNSWAIVKYPIIWGVLTLVLFMAIVFEVVISALERVLFKTLEPEAQARYLSNDPEHQSGIVKWWKGFYAKMLESKPMEQEDEIVLEHNYDGIRELDNTLPPWWVYLFYATVIFAVVYLVRFHVFDGTNQLQEFQIENEQAELQIAEYKKNNKDLIDAESVELLTDPSDLAKGKEIYMESCMACHKTSGGGGIGPNLTDEYWILGGGIKNVYNTISEGGRPGKGMIAWKSELKPLEIAQVSSYVLSLQGTNPEDGKEPEGELWTD